MCCREVWEHLESLSQTHVGLDACTCWVCVPGKTRSLRNTNCPNVTSRPSHRGPLSLATPCFMDTTAWLLQTQLLESFPSPGQFILLGVTSSWLRCYQRAS